jgi:ceramide glucosyltransferase
MLLEWLLLGWTAGAAFWWFMALRLVTRPEPKPIIPSASSRSVELTLFKPLPRLEGNPPAPHILQALESFFDQKDASLQILLGLHEEDRPWWSPVLDQWRRQYSNEPWQVVWRNGPDTFPNPKIAWQTLLAPHATGEWWMWSDADITAPPDFLVRARTEFSQGSSRLLTFAYRVTSVDHLAGCLDALFVNVEFLPGVLLLGGKKEIHFGLGAALLFHSSDFKEKIRWPELGGRLADDFYLGNTLGPARLGSTWLETSSSAQTWREAVGHYLRWQKTVRWCRPAGFAGQIVILPLLGWIVWTITHPYSSGSWLGLFCVVAFESLLALWISKQAGYVIPGKYRLALPIWSFLRALGWLACWLPWPVGWGASRWWGPQKNSP